VDVRRSPVDDLTMAFSSQTIARPAPGVTRSAGARRGLAAICLGFLMITLDATIVNVALGRIVGDLGGSVTAAQWVVNGYTIAFAALLLSAGALADRLGARVGYLIGLGIFGAGSAVCSAATTLGMLIAARVAQGMGAAWLMPCSLALITHTFPERRARRRALAIWAELSGVGLASGPVLGGVLTESLGWRAIFLVNLPVALVALLLLWRHVTETQRHPHPLDPAGQALAVATLSLLASGFILAGQRGWDSTLALGLLGCGVACGGGFIVTQRTIAHPMVEPALFARRGFSLSVKIALLFNFCLYGGLFCLAIVLAKGRGFTPLATGLAMLPMTLLIGLTAFASGRIVSRIGEWRTIQCGLTAGAIGAGLVAVSPDGAPLGLVIAATLPMGPVSMAMAALTATAMADAPPDRVGLASGVLNAARQAGGALGVGALGALLRIGGGLSLHAAFAGIALAYGVGVGLAVCGARWSARRAS